MTGKVVQLDRSTHAGGTDPISDEVNRLTRQIGTMVRTARGEKKFSRRKLSDVSGVSQRYLAQIEAGEGNISVAMLVRLGAALDISAGDFFRLEPAEAKTTRIALIGLRGAGKSTLGQLVADTTGLPFVELNDVVEGESGIPVSDVIALYGPEGYRRFESRALSSVIKEQNEVILAVAGGIVDTPKTYDLLLEEFDTIWLQAAPKDHMKRVLAQGDERPMAGNPKAMEELKAILHRREAAYARAHLVLDTAGRSPAESTNELLELVRDKTGFIG